VVHGAEQAGGGRFDIGAMDVERSPVTKGAVFAGGDGDDAERGIFAESGVADLWAFVAFFESNHKNVGQSVANLIEDFVFVGYLSNNFDAGLIDERREDDLSHEPGTVGDKNARRSLHGNLLALRVSAEEK
jgi:hypothetical protein